MYSVAGWKQDELDVRDKKFEADTNTPKEFGEMVEKFNINLTQTANSCVGYSLSNALYASWRMQGIIYPQIASPLFIWYNSRKTHGDELNNSGTYIRSAIKQMKKLGFCPNDIYDGLGRKDFDDYAQEPPLRAYHAAFDQKLVDLEYSRIVPGIEQTVVDIKKSLFNELPLILGLSVYDNFMNHIGSETICLPGKNDRYLGGHAVCGIGYNDEGLVIVNSWGKNWGNQGFATICWDYIIQQTHDVWSLNTPQYFSVFK